MIMDGLGMDGDVSTDITRGPGKWNPSCSNSWSHFSGDFRVFWHF